MVDQWEVVVGEARKLAREIVGTASEEEVGGFGGAAYRHADFRDALLAVAGDAGKLSSCRLGNWLLTVQGRIVGGRRHVQDGGRAGVVYWRLELVETS